VGAAGAEREVQLLGVPGGEEPAHQGQPAVRSAGLQPADRHPGGEHPVGVLVAHPGADAFASADTSVLAPPGPARGQPGAGLLRLVEVMDTLRTQCPWDARQTHESLAPHLLEESYEALDALERGDPAALRDELGDVLLQVVFHARIASER